jgi:tungstate transport system ATP-binding protein
MTEIYRLQNIERWFGDRRVLHVPELEIHAGACLGIIGPSGAGKSTLLRILAMLDRPTSGNIIYSGQILNGSTPIETRREITMVFQRAALLDQTVYENVSYGLSIRGIDAPDQVRAMLEMLGIEHLAEQPALSLSGGEMQRAAVARALVIQPRVLLLDEPTANLDPDNVAILERAISRAISESDTTVVLVSHNLHQVCRLASRVAGVIDGELVEHGPIEQVINRTENRKLRAFISGGIYA